MKSIIKKLSLMAVLAATLVAFAGVPAYAQTAKDDICEGVQIATGSDCDVTGGPTVESTMTKVIEILSIIVGIVAVIMIIIAGLKYITAGGDAAKVSSAKNTLLYAVIGLAIVALAQVIVRFVLNKVSQP